MKDTHVDAPSCLRNACGSALESRQKTHDKVMMIMRGFVGHHALAASQILRSQTIHGERRLPIPSDICKPPSQMGSSVSSHYKRWYAWHNTVQAARHRPSNCKKGSVLFTAYGKDLRKTWASGAGQNASNR